ncbi:MAG: Nramp family divalent metal transporter, partial [Candidatus Magasanikbacteria bacterium]|nr:Nramp family divalent metal transporter [Candidatus Magasanikbacteria bacterium]
MPTPTKFPEPIPLRKMIGPSFIILALGLGSGEVILWPYLVANYGLGIAWGAVLGITCQFFINMEIERYALVRGESVFVGLAKLSKVLPYWFILSTFIAFGLPGIIAAGAQLLANAVGITEFRWLAAALLIGIGLLLSLGKTVYGLMEKLTTTVVLIGVPFIFVLAFWVSGSADWAAVGAGLMGQGEGYRWLPEGIVLATFLGAFAYSGAAGNLNLTQSIYIKEKGYGMGAFSQKIAGLFHKGAHEPVKLEGAVAADTPANKILFNKWWRLVNTEHGLVFWGMGALAMVLLMLLSYATAYGNGNN